jgi:hypothetical protein
MNNQVMDPTQKRLPTRQAAVNRRIALGLALFALCIFVTVIIRQGLASG